MHSPASTVHDAEDLAWALETMAVGARGRSGSAAATAALQWAASLSTCDSARVRRLYAAAGDAAIAGEHVRAQALLAEADRLPTGEPAAVPAAETAIAAALAGLPDVVITHARGTTGTADLARGLALLQTGDVREGAALIRVGVSAAPRSSLRIRIAAGLGLTLIGEHRAALHTLSSATEDVWRTGAIRLLPAALCGKARAAAAVEPIGLALSAAREATAVARLTEDDFWLRRAAAIMAVLHAVRGDADLCHAAIELALPLGDTVTRGWVMDALNLLELGLGRRADPDHRTPAPDGSDLPLDAIEAQLRSGRRPSARVMGAVERISRDADSPLLAAQAWRTRGLLAAPSEYPSCFATALHLHRTVEQPFETARTLLAYGERLRRAGRRADARRPLREALEVFELLGARPWAERAAAELAATGDRMPRHQVAAGDMQTLTVQELQVARAVAAGLTNREVAQALFLSHKTIEFHLGNIFRKLGLRRRAQLVHHFLHE
jgi:DNA-binding CsgD family transcriptional regulator